MAVQGRVVRHVLLIHVRGVGKSVQALNGPVLAQGYLGAGALLAVVDAEVGRVGRRQPGSRSHSQWVLTNGHHFRRLVAIISRDLYWD